MQHRWRAVGLGAAALTVAATSACTSFTTSHAQTAAASSSSTAAALSSAEHAKPGTYGRPANGSLPNPTDVATDSASAPTTAVTSGGLQQVAVHVTYSGWDATTKQVLADGYVPSVVESGGNCTVTLTRGETSIQASSPAQPSASSTACGQLSVPKSKLTSGVWQAKISYKSTTSEGVSSPVQVTVP